MTQPHAIDVVSYNILNPYHALKHKEATGIETLSDGTIISNWPTRGPWITANLITSDFHVACLQEVGPVQAHFLSCSFSLLTAPFPDSNENGRFFVNALLYKPQVLRLDAGVELACNSIANSYASSAILGIFTHIATERRLAVVSTHLKGYNPRETDEQLLYMAQQIGYDQLCTQLVKAQNYAKRYDCQTIIIAGDFNEGLSSNGLLSRINLIEKAGFAHDGGLAPSEPSSGRRIDWIFASGGVLKPVEVNWPHPAASDHLPIVSRLELN